MVFCTRILFPTDFSRDARHALDYAAGLARSFGARIVALHVEAVFDSADHDFDREMREAVPAEFDDVVAERRRVRAKTAHQGILDEAKRAGCDLIVMGTHGRSGVAHVVLGSTAERVVQHSPVPVLTVRNPARPVPQA